MKPSPLVQLYVPHNTVNSIPDTAGLNEQVVARNEITTAKSVITLNVAPVSSVTIAKTVTRFI